MLLKDRIKKIRKELDLTQQKFADKLGIKRNTIAMYEMGKTSPSDQTIKSISREFSVNEEWLRTGIGEMFQTSPNEILDALADKYGLSYGDYILIEKFVNLNEEKREAVVDYVLQAAAAMQSEGTELTHPAINHELQTIQKPLDPQTATNQEKLEAYQEYLDEKGKKRREAN